MPERKQDEQGDRTQATELGAGRAGDTPKIAVVKFEELVEKEIVKYGTGKPRRVVIKAKIIND